VKIRIDHHQI